MISEFEIDVPARADEEVDKQETRYIWSLPTDSNTVDQVRDILGGYFDLFDKFFEKNFFESDSKSATATFLVTRRCFLLANWFLQYQLVEKKEYKLEIRNNCLCLVNNETDYKNYIFSDKGIFSFFVNLDVKKEIGKSVILDDIVIHGENLNKIKEELVDTIRETGAKVGTYKEACIESSESLISAVDKSLKKSKNGEWLIPSRRIVDFISFLNLPYISYFNSYTQYNFENYDSDQLIEKLDNNDGLKIFSFGEDRREILGKMSYFIAEKEYEVKNYEITKFIRYYYNCETKIACFVPFVQLKRLNRNTLVQAFSEYLEKNAFEKLVEELSKYEESCNKKEILIKQYDKFVGMLLNCVASNYYGYNFFNKYMNNDNIDTWYKDSINCLLMTFGQRIFDIITEKSNYNLSQDSNSKKKFVEEDEILLHKLKKEQDNVTGNFCSIRWAKCELAAFKREGKPMKESIDVIPTEAIQKSLGKDADKLLKLCSIVDFCDQGKLAIAINEKNLENVVEVGELGVMSARTSQDPEVRNILKKLLVKDYYKYLLV